jgi:hypothetical protein
MQLELPFGKKDTTSTGTVITVEYASSDFNGAIDASHEQFGSDVAVIAVPVGLKSFLTTEKRKDATWKM